LGVLIERCSQGFEVYVPVDATELSLRFGEAGGTPPQRHGARLPARHVPRVVTADLDHRLHAVGRAQRARQAWRDPQACHGEGLRQSLPQAGRRAGVSVVQFLGQRLEIALAGEGVGVAVGGPHALLDHAGHLVGQVAAGVADFTQSRRAVQTTK